MKLNLGCGAVKFPGYVNVDAQDEYADVRGDVRTLTFSHVEGVRMDHLLEHISHRETQSVLERIRSWMRPGALLTVEVPDMAAIMAEPRDVWLTDVYGVQDHEGEYHRAGFTRESLLEAITAAGFEGVRVSEFVSEHPQRNGLPCLLATGAA